MGSTILKIVPELKNSIINGNFDFWQRGTSASYTSSSTSIYLADRFFTNVGTAGYTFTTSRSTNVPTQAQSGFNSVYSMLVTNGTGVTVASGDNNSIGCKIEGQDYQALHSKHVRIQFWAQSSVTGTFPVALRNASANRCYVTTFTVTAANTWQSFFFDVTLDNSGTWGFDNTIGLRLEIYLTAGSTFQTSILNSWQNGNLIGATGQTQWAATTGATFALSQVAVYQIQAGAGITLPFVRAGRTIQQELAMCQRYYEKSYDPTVNPGTLLSSPNNDMTAWNIAGNSGTSNIYFKVTKRANPTLTVWNASTANTSGSWTGQASGGAVTNIVSTGVSQATIIGWAPIAVSATYLRMWGEFTADAEL